MRKLARLAYNILASFGGGPLSIGFDLPGTPQVAREPQWIIMSQKGFPEAILVETAKNAAKSEADWSDIYLKLYKWLDSPPQGVLLAVLLNNLAVAAYRAGRKDLATACIQRAAQIPVSILDVRDAIQQNMRIMG